MICLAIFEAPSVDLQIWFTHTVRLECNRNGSNPPKTALSPFGVRGSDAR